MSPKTFLVSLAAVASLLIGGSQAAAQAPSQQPGAQAAAPSAIAPAEPASSSYVLGRDDVVEVGLLGRSDFGGRARVQADGTIQLPFIGKIPAADKTTAELSETVRTALRTGGFFSDPVVVVEVVGYASRYVTVLGAVNSPGLIPLNRPFRLSEILARVGGVRDTAADHLIVRSEDGRERKFVIRELATGDAEQDPYVSAGDKIYAPAAETFYIYGQVNSPGVYPIQSGMTVRMALVRGAGLTPSGSDKKVEATRNGKKVKLSLSDLVEPGDVLFVGERLF
ncbi:SLBB domain-containing protein [Phenylobacterium kunshanense]|uniref:Polysaccharide transporter n=1 Tax=Phenylobacterium kunshanense TaxID=1445034 RepID=A0A328BIR3_9CAUL|nr:SLBB domain-containing protein [Phenylobacterium kunshanense]RAK66529.1 polysaccharide transporter [Phenylobacterium kunshanense]